MNFSSRSNPSSLRSIKGCICARRSLVDGRSCVQVDDPGSCVRCSPVCGATWREAERQRGTEGKWYSVAIGPSDRHRGRPRSRRADGTDRWDGPTDRWSARPPRARERPRVPPRRSRLTPGARLDGSGPLKYRHAPCRCHRGHAVGGADAYGPPRSAQAHHRGTPARGSVVDLPSSVLGGAPPGAPARRAAYLPSAFSLAASAAWSAFSLAASAA